MLSYSSESLPLSLRKVYVCFVQVFFFLFLLGVLFFGRAFSTLKFFDLPWFPLYVTDFFLILALPLVIVLLPRLALLPRSFKWIFGGLLAFSSSYLIWGFFVEGNKFALRDVVLSLYLLIVLLVFVLFSKRKMLQYFLWMLVVGNIVNILIGHYMILDNLWLGRTFNHFIHQGKIFNFTLYYGIVSSFLMAYGVTEKRGFYRVIFLILLSINLYLIYISSVRSAWVAFMVLIIFNFLVNRKLFVNFFLSFLVIFAAVGALLYRLDFVWGAQTQDRPFLEKMAGVQFFISEKMSEGKAEQELASEKKTISQEVLMPIRMQRYADNPGQQNFWDHPNARQLQEEQMPEAMQSTVASKKGYEVPTQVRIASDNIKWRLSIWQQTLEFGLQSLYFGRGFGRYPHYEIWTTAGVGLSYYIKSFEANSGIIPAHNSFLTVFYKMGLLGVLLFFALNLFVFWQGMRAVSTYSSGFFKTFLIGALGGLVYWHVMALFFDVIDSPPTNVFLWILLGLILALVYRKDELVNEKK